MESCPKPHLQPKSACPSFTSFSSRCSDAKAVVSGGVTLNPYNSVRWKRERIEHLRAEPWCRYCAARDLKSPATVVDHIKPWRGSVQLFWDRSNWQSLCKTCHDSAKQRLEKTGVLAGCDARGFPFDTRHHWNTK